MTVKELKEKLDLFPDYLIVMIPSFSVSCEEATYVSRGVNEADGCLFIDSYVGDD